MRKQFESIQEYQKWYYLNVTRPKRDQEKPEIATKRPLHKKPGGVLIHKCAFPACGKEFVARSWRHKHCSRSCSIKHGYDLKNGVERKAGEKFCPGCKKLHPETDFPINLARSTSRSGYCQTCHNEKPQITNAKGYKEEPESFQEAWRRYNKKRGKAK